MNRGGRPSTVSYTDLAIARFRNWPLQLCVAESLPGHALAVSGRQIVHFHQADLAEVHLTADTIGRLAPVLEASGRVDVLPAADWIQVHLDTDSDLSLLESLVSLAIQANDPDVRGLYHLVPNCPHADGTRRHRRRRSRPRSSTSGRQPVSTH